MQNGDYIVDRFLPKMVSSACQSQGISYQPFSDEWVIRLSKDNQVHWIFGYKFDCNPAAAAHIAQDKVATYQVLTEQGIPAVPHNLLRTPLGDHVVDSDAFGKVVLKPLNGTGGKQVELYNSVHEAQAAILKYAEPSWAFSPYFDVASEIRVIVLDGTIMLAYTKTNPVMRNGLKLFNLGLGATAVPISVDALSDSIINMSQQSMMALSLRLAAIDIAILSDGTKLVMEVNDGFAMEHYAEQGIIYAEQAASLYDTVIQSMFNK